MNTLQVHSTGYIQVVQSSSSPGDNKFGYNILHDLSIVGLLHNHFFVYKADLDIGDYTSNSFMVSCGLPNRTKQFLSFYIN